MFRQYTISGQMRFVVQMRLDIQFGDQLTCHYGINYFKETPDKKRKTNKGTKKRKMVIKGESDGRHLL
jgi:SET domain-containing protein